MAQEFHSLLFCAGPLTVSYSACSGYKPFVVNYFDIVQDVNMESIFNKDDKLYEYLGLKTMDFDSLA